jgi:hypothetical protein
VPARQAHVRTGAWRMQVRPVARHTKEARRRADDGEAGSRADARPVVSRTRVRRDEAGLCRDDTRKRKVKSYRGRGNLDISHRVEGETDGTLPE